MDLYYVLLSAVCLRVFNFLSANNPTLQLQTCFFCFFLCVLDDSLRKDFSVFQGGLKKKRNKEGRCIFI
jgi:hypothetical protein